MSTLRVNNLTAVGGTGTITVPTGNQVVQTGAILQVVQTVKTDTFSTTSSSFTDVTGMSASITPYSTSSKVLVMVDMKVSSSGDNTSNFRIDRGGTALYISDSAGSRTRATMGNVNTFVSTTGIYNTVLFVANYLDSPNTTSSTTYKIQMFVNVGTGYVNRTSADRDAAGYDIRSASSITLLEVAG